MRICIFIVCVALSGCAGIFSTASTSNSDVYVVKKGDTLTSIGQRYSVLPEDLQEYNRIKNPRRLRIGQRLTIPDLGPSQDVRSVSYAKSDKPSSDENVTRMVSLLPVRQYLGELALPVIDGRFSSRFGWRWKSFHEGVDLAAATGTPIRAAHDGVVVLARSNWGRYGKVIVIKGDNLMTVYAHNSRNLVRLGQRVYARDVIGEVGATGDVTGPHLHFETRVRNSEGRFAAVNPRLFYR